VNKDIEIQFGVKLKNVKSEEINFKEPDSALIDFFNDDNLKINIGLNFSFNLAKELLGCHITISYEYVSDSDEVIFKLLDYKGVFEFEVHNLAKIVSVAENGSTVFPNHLLAIVTGVSVSTSRGIIIAKTAGSFINKFYLPILHPDDLVKNFQNNLEAQSKQTL